MCAWRKSLLLPQGFHMTQYFYWGTVVMAFRVYLTLVYFYSSSPYVSIPVWAIHRQESIHSMAAVWQHDAESRPLNLMCTHLFPKCPWHHMSYKVGCNNKGKKLTGINISCLIRFFHRNIWRGGLGHKKGLTWGAMQKQVRLSTKKSYKGAEGQGSA